MVYSPSPIGQTTFDSPLKDSNVAIWSRDLPLMRAMGVNAIHVYNVTPPPYDTQYNVGGITNFLNAAWNGGVNPVYVIMSVYFTPDVLVNASGGVNTNSVNSLAQQYHDLDAKYAAYPAVMGTAISNELGATNYIGNPNWWAAFNQIATAAKQGFRDGGDGSKIVTTSEADGNLIVVQTGEANHAAVDVWGVNIYRGRTFTNLFSQIQAFTSKPVMLTEYGSTAAYHPGYTGSYTYGTGPTALGACNPVPNPPSSYNGITSQTDVAELPDTGNGGRNMAALVDYVTNNAALLYSGYQNGGVVSGGFYFEWLDEWWKAGNPSVHLGSVAFNGAYPGCNEDSGWYGLNQVAPGTPNQLNPRATLTALQNVWATQTP